MRRRPSVRSVAVPLLPVAVLLVLGAVELSRHLALWYDEDYTLLAVRTPLPQLLSAVWHARGLATWLTVPPSFNAPYYVLMHGWCAVFGTSTFALRLPALLCSAAAVAVVAVTVRRLADDQAGVVAGLLSATGPLLAQQAVEARSYGAAELATALTALLLVRRHEGRGGRLPLALAAGAAGLLHWFTLPVLLGLAVWTLLVRRRQALPDLVAVGVAVIPALALVALSFRGGGTGTPVTQPVGIRLPLHAVEDWSLGGWALSAALVAAFVVALLRSRWRGLLACWLLLPLAVVTAGELVRPLYFGRYLLFAMLGLAAGAALGVCSLPARRLRATLATVLVALSFVVVVPRLQTEAREHPERVIALLTAQQQAGEPVVAADGRAAIEMVEQMQQESSRLRVDLVLRPGHVPVGGTERVVWLVRSGSSGSYPGTPNTVYLTQGGWSLDRTVNVAGGYGDLAVQRWVR